MSDFYKAFQKFRGIEFSREDNVLHKNAGENGLTYYGIYQSAHPHWNGWSRVMTHLTTHGYSRREASIVCYHDEILTQEVMYFYYMNFWLPLRLDELTSQKIAEELFFFYLNIGNKKRVIKYAQSIVNTKADGILGSKTLKALNEFDDRIFDIEYDKKQISHYRRLVTRSPGRYARFLKGWISRSYKI